ncbi:MAG: recombinase family protein [Armatimonadetes bacterium]|nr:recombinase family protein [Armatimonadota bacterium]
MPTNKPFLLYSRKSTEEDERQAQSLENQTSLGVSLAKQLGVELEVVEDAHSAKEPGRPRFDDILARIDKGEIGGLIAWHPDRLSRNEMDAAAICFRLRKKILPELHFVNYYFHNSPEGIMMLQIALSQSQYTSSKLSEDVKRGMKNKIKKGWYPHRAPLGYVNDKHKDQGERTISKDELRFPIIRRAWDALLTESYTLPHLLDLINNDWGLRTALRKDGTGDKPLALNTLCRMFSNVFYAGYFYHDGELFQGAHEPMVTLDEFERAQKLFGRKNPLRPRTTQTLPYTGLIKCAFCKGQITATVKTKPSGRSYTYYHCKGQCPRKKHGVREDILEQKIAEQLAEMGMHAEFYLWAAPRLARSRPAVGRAIGDAYARSDR